MSNEKNFNAKYVDELVDQYMLIYPKAKKDLVRKHALKLCKERYKNPKVNFLGKDTSLMNVINYIEEKKPIMSGFGTFFVQHEERKSIEYDLVQSFIDLRAVYKAKKFEHINDKDKTEFNKFDIYQLTYKLMNNSFYGVLNEPNSFFYHPLLGSSITQTGVVIITTSVNLFEKVMSANMLFRNINDISLYAKNILNEDYNIYDYIDKPVKKSRLLKFLYERCTERTDKIHDQIKSMLKGLSEEECNKIYFKNNFYEMMRRSKIFRKTLKSILGEDKFLDPNNPPKEYIPALEKMWNIFNTVCHYNYLDFYRMENAKYKKRKTVLTVNYYLICRH